MVTPRPASVRPRVVSPDTGETLLLEDEVDLLIRQRRADTIWLVGPPGSGKTTALEHLAAVLKDRINQRLNAREPPIASSAEPRLLDDGDPPIRDLDGPIVKAAESAPSDEPQSGRCVVLTLSGWGRDEFMEYLLCRHRNRCASILARLSHPEFGGLPDGRPELWRQIFDLMATDESLVNIRQAVR